MTPARLIRLKCPNCATSHWMIDYDFPGEGSIDCDIPSESTPELDLSYEARVYACPHCGRQESGHQVQEKSPPEFFLQPHNLYPMEPQEFMKWVAILREHFPDNPLLADYGTKWYAGKKSSKEPRTIKGTGKRVGQFHMSDDPSRSFDNSTCVGSFASRNTFKSFLNCP